MLDDERVRYLWICWENRTPQCWESWMSDLSYEEQELLEGWRVEDPEALKIMEAAFDDPRL